MYLPPFQASLAINDKSKHFSLVPVMCCGTVHTHNVCMAEKMGVQEQFLNS